MFSYTLSNQEDSVNLDQMPQNATPDQDLHCLQLIQ